MKSTSFTDFFNYRMSTFRIRESLLFDSSLSAIKHLECFNAVILLIYPRISLVPFQMRIQHS